MEDRGKTSIRERRASQAERSSCLMKGEVNGSIGG